LEFASSRGLGARSDSRAIAIATAPASTASPASCPPMRRSSIGTVAAASAARKGARGLAELRALGDPTLGVGLAETVGNKPEGSAGDTPVPGMAGKFCCAGIVTVGLGILALGSTTLSRADPVNDNACAPVALADISTSSPRVANAPTFTVACSSST